MLRLAAKKDFADYLALPSRGKNLGHLWLGFIRMLGHLQLSAHRTNFERLLASSSRLKILP